MRKSFDGLAATTRGGLGADPHGGALFVFRNRAATLVKILWWDRAGWCLFAKRLERGRFRLPVAPPAPPILQLLTQFHDQATPLEQRLAQLLKQTYGRRSERVDPAQLRLLVA